MFDKRFNVPSALAKVSRFHKTLGGSRLRKTEFIVDLIFFFQRNFRYAQIVARDLFVATYFWWPK